MFEGARIAIAIFEGAEELDWAGPWEVFAAWANLWPDDGISVYTVADTSAAVRCGKGLRVLADHTWQTAPNADLVVYPGGPGARAQVGNPAVRERLRELRATSRLMASVCTGALVYADAGLLDGRAATTHWSALDLLAGMGRDIDVRREDRWVDAGDVLTSAGVSAGIDLALHLVARLHSPERADDVRHYIQYEPPETWEGSR